MTDHITPPDTDVTDAAFEQLARSAGAELRRPAPSDGVRRLRAARRRHQIARAVTAGGAAVLLVGMGVAVTLRGSNDSGEVATVPDSVVVPTTVVEPSPTSTPPSPTSLPVAPETTPDELQSWLADQRADGMTLAFRALGDGTDAWAVLAQSPDGADTSGIVVLSDTRTVDIPRTIAEGMWSTLSVYGLGDRVAVITQPFIGGPTDPVPVSLHLLDTETLEWFDGPALELDRELGAGLNVRSVDGSLLVGQSMWTVADDNTAVPSPDRAGVIVRPDLTVESVASPPDGVQMEWTSDTERWALNFGREPGAFDHTPYNQPWKLDVERNQWSIISLPDWLDCNATVDCQWLTPHEFGDRFLEFVTDRGVIKRIPDGTVGIYDPSTDTWTRVDDPPFALAMPSVGQVGDQVVVAPARAPYTEDEQRDFGQIGVLDLTAGAWTVERFDVDEADTRWELRTDTAGVLAQPVPDDPGEQLDIDRAHAIDHNTTTWRPATNVDAERWVATSPQFSLAD